VETDPRFPEAGTFSGRESVTRFFAGRTKAGGAVARATWRRRGGQAMACWQPLSGAPPASWAAWTCHL